MKDIQVSKEFLVEAFGLTLLVALLLISSHLFQRATRLTDLLEDGQEQQIIWLEEYDLIKYEGLVVDGMTAISYIKTVTGNYGVPVKIVTDKAEFTVTKKEEYANLRKIGSETYINPLAKYLCTVVRNENGTITEITIVIEMEGEEI